MRRIVIAGSRHRGWEEGVPAVLQAGSPFDNEMISEMLKEFKKRYAEGFVVLTLGCDAGFGKMVKRCCDEAKVGMVESIAQFNGHLTKAYFELLHLGRHAFLLDMGQEFHIFVTKHRTSNIEDLVGRLRMNRVLPYFIYDERHQVIESGPVSTPAPVG